MVVNTGKLSNDKTISCSAFWCYLNYYLGKNDSFIAVWISGTSQE